MKYLIGLDIGTTSCKSIVADLEGKVVGNGIAHYPVLSTRPSWAELDPEAVFAGVLRAVRSSVLSSGVLPDEIIGLGVSGALHSVLAVDAQGEALTRAIPWADNRSADCAARIKREYDGHRLYRRTGCPVHSIYLPAKLVWLRENIPEVYRKAHKFVSVKEYVLHKLTGKFIVDRSVASGAGLLNIHELGWDEEVLEIVGVTSERLSELVPTTTILEGIEPDYAEAMGIPSAVLLVVGAGDGLLSNVGAGSVEPGQATVMIGSSGAVRVISKQPKVDEEERTWCYLLTNERWAVGGAINNAGLVYRWFRDRFCPAEVEAARRSEQDPYEPLNAYAAEVGVGCDGLIFLPYLTGERSPRWNANARGVLFGLSLHHDRRHVIRAIMEGVAYRMYSVFLALEEVAGPVKEIRAAGGFLRSALWTQILADVFGRDLVIPEIIETSALGAVFLSLYALGYLRELEEARRLVPIKKVYHPDMGNHAEYERLFGLYQRIYQNLIEEFDEISEMQHSIATDNPSI
jgi:gluconokinase